MIPLTYDQFLSTKTVCADLGTVLQDECFDGPVPATGFLYMGGLYIGDVMAHWPEAARKAGKFHLLIGNGEYITNDIEDLEHKLFDFAFSEGYTFEGFLCEEFKAYCRTQNLPHLSADELICEELTEAQSAYVSAFIVRWDEMLKTQNGAA